MAASVEVNTSLVFLLYWVGIAPYSSLFVSDIDILVLERYI